MTALRAFLLLTTILIFAITIWVTVHEPGGFNWPVVFFSDVLALNWRSQFNVDFLIHLFLFAFWIAWREGFRPRGFVFGFLAISQGGMFGFPYLLYATYKAKGDPKHIALGVHAHT